MGGRRPSAVVLLLLTVASALVGNLATNTIEVAWAWWPVVAWSIVALLAAVSVGIEWKRHGDAQSHSEPVRRIPPEGSQVLLPRLSRLPRRLQLFTGRTEILEQIAEQAAQRRRPDTIVLTGIGAVGKTSLALEYAHATATSRRLVGWIPAADTAQAQQAFVALSQDLGVVARSKDEVVRQVLAALGGHEPWMLVYDDATPESVAGMLPTAGDGLILITSRGGDWGNVGTTIEVAPLATAEAVALLVSRSGDRSPGAEQHALALAGRLGNLPLALELAGAYCRDTCTLREYRELLDRRGVSVMRRAGTPISSDELAVRLSGERFAKDTAATQLLRLLAFLPPGYVSQRLLTTADAELPGHLAQVARDPVRWHAMLRQMSAAGLIRIEPGQLWVHQLVQEVQRDSIAEQSGGVRRRAAALVLGGDPSARWTEAEWRRLADRLQTRLIDVVATPELVDEVVQQLGTGPLTPPMPVALLGAGGMGKTTVARMVATDDRVRGRFPGGSMMFLLGRYQAAGAEVAIVHDALLQLTGEDHRPADAGAARTVLQKALAGMRQSTLLILDDVWRREHLALFLGDHHHGILVTTRNFAVTSQQSILEVQPHMWRRHSIDLLRRGLPQLAAPLADEMAMTCGDWALALALVNSHLRAVHARNPADLPSRAREIITQVNSYLDARDRHEPIMLGLVDVTLQGALAQLPETDRRRVLELAVFPEDEQIPLAQIAQLWAMTADQTCSLVHDAHDLGLLEFDQRSETVLLHDTVREAFIAARTVRDS